MKKKMKSVDYIETELVLLFTFVARGCTYLRFDDLNTLLEVLPRSASMQWPKQCAFL